MKKFFSAAVLLSLLVASSAFAEVIDCPLQTAHATVSDPLPSPWWTTPQEGNLVSVEVMAVGGKDTLMCKYWAYDKTVTVQRRAPEGKKCVATGKNFNCN